jgi:hypothetical protein
LDVSDAVDFQLELLALRKAYFVLEGNFALYKTTVESELKEKIDSVVVNKDAEVKHWKDSYEDEQSFWNSKGLWYGLGAATIVIIEIIINLAKK